MPKIVSVEKGDKYGRLTIIEEVEPYIQRNGASNRQFRCSCDCGNEKITLMSSLRNNKCISCGCYQKEVATKHGKGYHYLYGCWSDMKQRCYNQKNKHYKDYGGRGIKVCDRWLESFLFFLEDMGERPSGMSLDRINNNGNYEPLNCRWATNKEQVNNRRNTKSVES